LTIDQAAEYCGTDPAIVEHLLQKDLIRCVIPMSGKCVTFRQKTDIEIKDALDIETEDAIGGGARITSTPMYEQIAVGMVSPANKYYLSNFSECFQGGSEGSFDKPLLLRYDPAAAQWYRYHFWDCGVLTLADVKIPREELDRYEAERSAPAALVGAVNKRHTIQPEERKAKGSSAIQSAVNVYLDSVPDGNKAGFYGFLKAKIKLTTNEILKDGEGYDIFFKSVTESGSKEGVYLNHAKEGKKEGEAGYNHYSGGDITTLISREKGNRKK
jgi:hypothetical protein